MLHGLTGDGACWLPIAHSLAPRFEVVLPDARGHGRSSTPACGYRYDDLASDAIGLVRHLRLTRPVLVGHSMGGLTAALIASRVGALLRGLVLVDPAFLSLERQVEVYASDVAEQHRRLRARPRSEIVADLRARHPHRSTAVIEHLATARSSTSIEAFEILEPPNPPYRELMEAIDVPTLIAIGDHPVVSLELASELGSRVQVAQIANAGHGLPFDQPERLGEVIAAFVDTLER